VHGLDTATFIRTDKFFFLDAVTKETASEYQVLYLTGPGALTELNIGMRNALEMKGIDAVLFDSLSTLLIERLFPK
jgi:hypothetical protein